MAGSRSAAEEDRFTAPRTMEMDVQWG